MSWFEVYLIGVAVTFLIWMSFVVSLQKKIHVGDVVGAFALSLFSFFWLVVLTGFSLLYLFGEIDYRGPVLWRAKNKKNGEL